MNGDGVDFRSRGGNAADAIYRIVCNDKVRARWPELRGLLDFIAAWINEIAKVIHQDFDGTEPVEWDPQFELSAIMRLLLEVFRGAESIYCEGVPPRPMPVWHDREDAVDLKADVALLRENIRDGMRALDSCLAALEHDGECGSAGGQVFTRPMTPSGVDRTSTPPPEPRQVTQTAPYSRPAQGRSRPSTIRFPTGDYSPQATAGVASAIIREQALDLAIDHLVRSLRASLKIDEGWPREASYRADKHPRAVWRVLLPSDEQRVGAHRFLIIDRQTGEVLADQWYGE